MHEMAIAQSIVEAILDEVDGRRVIVVRLSVGELSGVAPEAIRFCFDVIVEGTVLAGTALDIDQPVGTARCRSCENDFIVADLVLLCPCGSTSVTLQTGRELTIRSVEVV